MTEIHWPAVVKLVQNDELLYLPQKRDWLELACLYQRQFSDDDYLIDNMGHKYHIVGPSSPKNAQSPVNALDADESPVVLFPWLQAQHSDISITEFVQLVRFHAQATGQCCSAKLAFSTIDQGIAMVKYLEEQDI